jgi:alanine-glyoxylate transaminase/serine-glyoxylate transaminase/serine-pyruvate transaminase
VDVAVTGSQKGFMLPRGPGHHRLQRQSDGGGQDRPSCRAPSLTSTTCAKGYENNAYPYTPAIGLMNGLNTAAR